MPWTFDSDAIAPRDGYRSVLFHVPEAAAAVTTASTQQPAPGIKPVHLRPRPGWKLVDFTDLWYYRELLWFLAMRDVKVRYKQALFGFAWALIQPVVPMLVMAVFFGKLGGMEEQVGGAYPYFVFLFAGMLPWTFFAAAIGASSGSLVNNQGLVQKVYFPRLIMPVAAVGAPLVDHLVALVALIAVGVWQGVPLSWSLLWVPVVMGIIIVASLAVGVLLAALMVSYRDFRYIVPLMIQVWFFGTPAIYADVSKVPDRYQWLIAWNPMNDPIAAFRAAVLNQPIDFQSLGKSLVVIAAVLLVGLIYFRKTERRFADVI